MTHNHPGFFIVFEGPDGGGKTTQIKLLVEWLKTTGVDFLELREPGGTEIGEEIRDLVHNMKHAGTITNRTEALLYQASRAQNTEQNIAPALKEGKVVLSDRYRDSSIVYQGITRGLGHEKIDQLNDFSTGGLEANITICVMVSAEECFRRKMQGDVEWNRLDAMSRESREQIILGYETLSSSDDRWIVIDGERDILTIQNEIRTIFEKRLIKEGIIEGPHSGTERR